jgi:hypothetical protein
MENAGEGLIIYAKSLPWLKQLREETGRPFLANAEWVAANSENAKKTLARFVASVEKQRAAK